MVTSQTRGSDLRADLHAGAAASRPPGQRRRAAFVLFAADLLLSFTHRKSCFQPLGESMQATFSQRGLSSGSLHVPPGPVYIRGALRTLSRVPFRIILIIPLRCLWEPRRCGPPPSLNVVTDAPNRTQVGGGSLQEASEGHFQRSRK